MAVCGPPPRNYPPVVDLRVCVQGEATVEVYRRYFAAATAAEPGDGQECDVTVRRSILNAGKVVARSAYDGSVLAEPLGPPIPNIDESIATEPSSPPIEGQDKSAGQSQCRRARTRPTSSRIGISAPE